MFPIFKYEVHRLILWNKRGYMMCLIIFFGFYKYEINIKSSWLKNEISQIRTRYTLLNFCFIFVFIRKYGNRQKNIEIRVWPCGGVGARERISA